MHNVVEWFLIAVTGLLALAAAFYLSKPLGFQAARVLAGFCQNRGWFNLALPLWRNVLDTSEKKFGKTNIKVVESLVGLADVHHHLRQYGQAMPLYERALGILEKRHGENGTAVSIFSNLADCRRASGRLDEALVLYQRALDLTERTLGKDHPDLALALDNVAEVYSAQGRLDQALPLYERAVKLSERTLGQRHEQTLALAERLAFCRQGFKK